jgi:murein DD-endopeptidase MepM/ murein hydrolase activator NlpD
MNHRYGIFSLFLGVIIVFFCVPVIRAADDTIHVVAKGETVYSISRTYRISQEELMKYNGITDASKLQVGSRLRIPPGSPVTGTSVSQTKQAGTSATVAYKVVKNDTLFSIARNHEITVQKLREINGFSADYVIKAGEIIKVPAKAAPSVAKPDPGADARKTSTQRLDTSVRWPVTAKEVAYMTGKLYGVVVAAERSESVKSLTPGTVVSAGPYRGFGRVVIVEVSGGYLYVYGGCESLSVKEGDRIGPGMELGKLGIDAVSGKPQLFFMVYQNNTPIDPAKAPRA